MAGPLRLITIGFSHYCEKARWALDRSPLNYREEDHAPLFHWRATLAAGGRSVPMLIAQDRVLRDSTAIVKFVDEHLRAGQRLFPEQPGPREEVTTMVAEFDRVLGPAVRRWLYFQVLSSRSVAVELLSSTGTAWERAAVRRTFPLLRGIICRGLKIDRASAERSRKRVQASFAAVEARLADGRPYLVGDRFTAADLSFAALAGVLIQPTGYGFPIPGGGQIAEVAAAVSSARASAAGRFVQRIYDEERPASRGGLER